jgi:hypothetical protein
MSWRENIDTNIVIVCGDGKSFSPLYRISPRSKNYHTAQYNFPNIAGTLVQRRLPESYSQTVDLIFQGPDHLEDIKNFMVSADDPRPWAVYHPMYGNIDVQPISISEDASGLGLTEVRVEWMETIPGVFPNTSIDPQLAVQGGFENTNIANAEAYDAAVLDPSPEDRVMMQNNIDNVYENGQSLVTEEVEANKFYDLYKRSSAKINEGIDRGAQLATAIITFMTYPSLFTTSIKARLLLFKRQMIAISNAVTQFNFESQFSAYEMQAGSLMSGMANAAVQTNTDQELNSAPEITDAIQALLDSYGLYLTTLDSLQTEFAGLPGSYTPNPDFATQLDSLVNLAASQLYNVALNAKQERSFVTDVDTNLILLTHRVYGLTPNSDQELNEFMNQNGIGINEILQIKKGRRIVYYV